VKSFLILAVRCCCLGLSLALNSCFSGVRLKVGQDFDRVALHCGGVYWVVCLVLEFQTVTTVHLLKLALLGKESDRAGPGIAACNNDTEDLLGSCGV
jgi:hypothetical protein